MTAAVIACCWLALVALVLGVHVLLRVRRLEQWRAAANERARPTTTTTTLSDLVNSELVQPFIERDLAEKPIATFFGTPVYASDMPTDYMYFSNRPDTVEDLTCADDLVITSERKL